MKGEFFVRQNVRLSFAIFFQRKRSKFRVAVKVSIISCTNINTKNIASIHITPRRWQSYEWQFRSARSFVSKIGRRIIVEFLLEKGEACTEGVVRGLQDGRGKKCKFNQTDNRSSREVAPSRRGEIVNWRGEVRNGSFGRGEGERERERGTARWRIDWLGRVSLVSWHANAFLKRLVRY